MKVKLTVLCLVGSCLLLGTGVGLTQDAQQVKPRKADEEGLLKRAARQAKAEGKTEVRVPAPIYRPAGVTSLDETLSHYTLVLATPVDSKSYVQSPYEIDTWYKFKVIEYLNRKEHQECSTCPSTPAAPAEMLPLRQDEILIPRPSGTAMIDGVRVTSIESGFPPFFPALKYLLFVQLDSSSKVGMLRMGAYGVFTLGVKGDIRFINNKSHPLKYEIESLNATGNAVGSLRDRVRDHPF